MSYKIDAAIVGVADVVSPTGKLHMPRKQLEATAAKAALANANLKLDDVDALYSCYGEIPALELAEYLRIQPRISNSTNTGGSAFEVHVQHASMALTLGQCDVALIVYGGIPRYVPPGRQSLAGEGAGADGETYAELAEWEVPYGSGPPFVPYAMAAQLHKHRYGTTSEQLAEIAVSTREWACKNPVARFQKPITVDDVLQSPMLSEPLHLLDCCLFTDGGGAIVMTRRDRAKDLVAKPVYVIGAGTSQSHCMMISQMPDLTETPGRRSASQALKQAGVRIEEVDMLQTYDSFTITVLLSLEDIGFCEKGEGGAFVENGRLGPGGALPTNTSGGGLSYTHPGMFGIFLLVEAARQLQGAADERQVDDVKVALAHGTGGLLSCTSTVVLTNEEER